MTHELRNTREAIDDLPESNWPGPGEFMADKPLAEADLRAPADHGQLSFLDECEGMCGT